MTREEIADLRYCAVREAYDWAEWQGAVELAAREVEAEFHDFLLGDDR